MLLRFGPNELNPASFELRRSRRRIRLATRPMELLLLLVQRRGELMTREEIARSLWPGVDVEDLTARINTTIAQIRGALDDDASRPRYLETVIGKGYRFVAVVEEVRVTELLAAGQSHEAVAPEQKPAQNTTQEPALGVERYAPEVPRAAALELITADERFDPMPLPPAAPAERAQVQQAPPHSRQRLTVLPVALGVVALGVFLILTVGALVYSRHARQKLPAVAPWIDRQVTENDSDVPVSTAALSPDGRFLAYSDPAGVFIQDLATAQTRQVRSPPLRAVRLAWLTQQKNLLLTGYAATQNQPQIWILSAEAGAPRMFRQSGQDAVPSPNGASIAFLTEDGREIRIADVSGVEERTIAKAAAAGTYSALFWSANGQRISYQQRALSPNGSVEMESNYEWTYGSREVATGTQIAFLANLAFDSAQESSDGRMFYLRSRAGSDHDNRGIWMVQTDPGSGRLLDRPQRLEAQPYLVMNGMTVSADGRQVAATREAWQPDIYVGEIDSPISALRQVKRITSNLRSDFPHSWDAKSQFVYFESNRAACGRFHIFRQPIDSQSAEMLTGGDEGQFFPAITAGGKALVYEQWPRRGSREEKSIDRANPDGTNPALVWKEGDLDEFRCPIRAGASCVLRETQSHEQFVFYRLDLATGKGEELARCAWLPSVVGDWDLSPDGSEAAIPSHDKESPSILLVPLHGKGATRTLKVDQELQLWGVHWAADGSGFFAEARSETEHRLEFIDLAGNVHTLRATQGNTWGVPSPDGKKLAFVDSTTNANVFIWQP
jgi:DNA-binding winged helix-turn-helix (wHTH) protein/Tol biopolymer transport system component